MATTTKEDRERRYRGLLAEQVRSGMSMRKFAEKHGIPAGTLGSWKHELKQRDAARAQGEGGKTGFLPVRIVAPTMTPAAATAGYEILLGRDFVLRLPRDFEVARVAALLKAVSSC